MMKKYVVMDSGGRRIDVQADSYTRTEGVLVFVKGAAEVAAFAATQWAWVQEQLA